MSQAAFPYRTVLVTRPAHQAAGLLTALKLRGYTGVAAPVLDMHVTDMAIPKGDFDALVFTSANGVTAFVARDARRDMPVYAVGPSTAAAARKAQFEWILAGEQGAEAVAGLMRGRLASGTRVLHPAGRDVAVDMAAALEGSGIHVERVALYAMEPAVALPEAALAAIAAGCVAPLYSARSAMALVALARSAGLSLENVLAIVPADKLLEDLAPAGFKSLLRPLPQGDDALIDLLDSLEAVKGDL